MTNKMQQENKRSITSEIFFSLLLLLVLSAVQTVLALLNVRAQTADVLWVHIEWNITELVVLFLIAFVLNNLAERSLYFRNAGASIALAALVQFLLRILPEDFSSYANESIPETVLLVLWYLLCLAAEYNESCAYAKLLEEGHALAGKWKTYWHCFAGAMIGLAVCLFVFRKNPTMSIATAIVFGGLLLVLRLLKIVYLAKEQNWFRKQEKTEGKAGEAK